MSTYGGLSSSFGQGEPVSEKSLLSGDSSSRLEFTSSCGATMLRVAGGPFTVGSPETETGRSAYEQRRDGALLHDFYLGKTPITQRQFESVMGQNPSDHPDAPADAPVDSVCWEQVDEFCRRLTSIDHEAHVLPSGWLYRLPTEVEWEIACRAGSDLPQYGELDAIAWYAANAQDTLHSVGQKEPNRWGFHDMLGNVWEWCQDWFHREHRKHAVRGGSYFNTSKFCRAAAREGYGMSRYVGFRVMATQPGPLDLLPAVDQLPSVPEKTSIYTAIKGNDRRLAQQLLIEDSSVLESMDEVPPPVHWCIYQDRPDMLSWLLDRGANIERREQDHGATPLDCAIVMRHKAIIPLLISRGANTKRALEVARNGLAGRFETYGLQRDGYQEIVQLLIDCGCEEPSRNSS